ncbi:hypothetical protein FHR81_004263 [Actinoalloteichus hoggarensis]|uniref:Serine/threonine-protein kinase AfsK n=1 Tax=Actinoalloteichus hoggarensis TaxID=1470176 RepID=A0A221W9K7_9PSEU|nr:serine/threonine-protein kinase [Actinoalloteichus hoggarensis]ASO22381.1 Serine/threonine-protein kinase AfsK [Actinoalloteichus hoggarensis]MBB5923196.1 hypothetical protein [Actinoalloteichus hoggarensis]
MEETRENMEPLEPGDPQVVGRHRLVGRLGSGGMGRVYLALSPDGRVVAVKLIHREHVADPMFRGRFRREVDAARRVSGAYTAAVMDADAEAELPWLVTVYVPGPSLREVVRTHGPLPVSSVRTLAVGLAAALREVHRARLIHRDLTPANVLLTDDGPRVIDFGITKAIDADTELTGTGLIIGSPGFLSPEHVEGRDLTPASDVFSLGATLFFAAAGTGPFGKVSSAALLYRVVHTEPLLGGLPPELRPVIEPCLARSPESRPTPEQLLDLLGSVRIGSSWLPEAVRALVEGQQDRLRALRDGQAEAGPGEATSTKTSSQGTDPAAEDADATVRVDRAPISAGRAAGAPADPAADPRLPHSWTPPWEGRPTNAVAPGVGPASGQSRPANPQQERESAVPGARRRRDSARSAKYAVIAASLAVVVAVIVVSLVAATQRGDPGVGDGMAGGQPTSGELAESPTDSPEPAGETLPPGARLPEGFAGEWTGIVEPADGVGARSYARLSVSQGAVGDVVGEFLRFVSGCTADLELTALTTHAAILTEIDRAVQTEGHLCAQPETTTLTLADDGSMRYESTGEDPRVAVFQPAGAEVPETMVGRWSGSVIGVEHPDIAAETAVDATIEIHGGAFGNAEVYVELADGCHHASRIVFGGTDWITVEQIRVLGLGEGCPLVPEREVMLVGDDGTLRYHGTGPALSGSLVRQ